MTAPHRLIYFGSSELSADILRFVLEQIDTNLEIAAVITQAAKPHAHAHQIDTPVARVAQEHGLPLIRPVKISEALSEIKALHADAGLLFAYGQLLPTELIKAFPRGIVNIHPSLLPKHRGPSPIEATILNGDTLTGTSLMLITEQMDAGPILKQTSFPITNTITKNDLTQKLLNASKTLLIPTLLEYLAGTLTPTPQDDDQATYCKLIHKDDGKIELTSTSAQTLLRMIRAYADWPGVSIALPERLERLRIYEAASSQAVAPQPGVYRLDKQLIIATRDGTIQATRVQLPGKRILEATEAINGLRLPVIDAPQNNMRQ